MQKLRIGLEDFGWEIAHAAVSRRPSIPLTRIVAHTEGYTHAAKVCKGPASQGSTAPAWRWCMQGCVVGEGEGCCDSSEGAPLLMV